MSTIEELKQKRKELDAEIKRLLNEDFCQVGKCKLDKEHYPTSKPDEYYVAVQITLPDSGKLIWRSVARSTDKQECIEMIPGIVENLSGLYKALKGDW